MADPVVAGSAVAGIAIVALALSLAAVLLATLANRRWVRDRSLRQQVLPAAELSGAVNTLGAELAKLRADLLALDSRGTSLAQSVAASLRHVAIVRYDAFADVGGRLSYSLAILDDTACGLVITSLSGKSDVRTYAKAVSAGTGEGSLTPEEQQAISAAVGSIT